MPRLEDYLNIRDELAKVKDDDEYHELTALINPFADMAEKLRDFTLANKLRQCGTLAEAISCCDGWIRDLFGTVPTGVGLQKEAKPPSPPPSSPSPAPTVVTRAPQVTRPAEVGHYIRFDSLERMLEFVDSLVSGRVGWVDRAEIRIRPPRDSRQGWELFVPALDESAQELLAILGGRETSAPRADKSLSINECLERVPLRERRKPPAHLTSLFVLVSDEPMLNFEDEIAKIHRSFPQGLYVECQFFPQLCARSGERGMLILFYGFHRDRRVYDWVNRLPRHARAFYPLTPTAENIFYCRWGFRHPVVALTRLYDPEDARYILIDHGENGWLKVRREEAAKGMASARQMFAVRFDWSLPRSSIFTVDETVTPVELPLQAKPTSTVALAQCGSIARQIDYHRQLLTQLERKYEKIQHFVSGQCRAALVFFSESTDSGNALPPRLRVLLQRPYATLANYRYVWLKSPRPGVPARHILISQVPMELSDILSAGADELFLQDPRWQGWGVNIFCESHLELSPRLDDPAMAQQLLEHLNTAVGQPVACWLISALTVPRRRRESAPKLIALGIPQPALKPLPEALRLINIHSEALIESGVEESLRQIVDRVDANTASSAGKVQGVYELIASDLDSKFRKALDEWVALNSRIERLYRSVKEAEADIKKLEDIAFDLAPTWERYVQAILDLHLTLSRKRLALFEELEANLEAFESQKAKAEVALRSAQEEVSRVLDTIQAHQRDIDRQLKLLQSDCNQLSEQYKKFAQDRQKLERQWRELLTIAKTLERQWLELKGMIQPALIKVARKLQGLKADIGQARRVIETLKALSHAIDSTSRELKKLEAERAQAQQLVSPLESLKQVLDSNVEALKKQKDDLLQKKQQLETEIKQLTDEEPRLKAEIPELTAELANLTAQLQEKTKTLSELRRKEQSLRLQEQSLIDEIRKLDDEARRKQLTIPGLQDAVMKLNNYFVRLRQAAREVEPQGREFVAKVYQLVRLLQKRPTPEDAQRIRDLLWWLLLYVPYGFYPSEWSSPAGGPQGSNDRPSTNLWDRSGTGNDAKGLKLGPDEPDNSTDQDKDSPKSDESDEPPIIL